MAVSSFINRARSMQQIPRRDRLLQTRLLWMFLLRTVLYTALLVIVHFLEESNHGVFIVPTALFFLLILSIYAFTIFSAFYLLIFQYEQEKFGFIQMIMDTIFTSLLILCSGVSHSNLVIVYCFSIIASGLILPSYGGLVTAALAILEYGFLLFLESHNIILPCLKNAELYVKPTFIQSLNLFSVHGLIFFLTGFLSIFFGQKLRHTESALSTSLAQFGHLSLLYQKIFNSISTGILTIDNTSHITSANNAVSTITGLPLNHLIGRRLSSIFPKLQEKNENIRSSMSYQRGDDTLTIGYSCIPLKKDNEAHRHRYENDDEELVEKIFTIHDVTEMEKLEQQVRQAEKLAAIGTMSASIAHDFRNPLAAISGSAQMLEREFDKKGEKTNLELTRIILRESERLTETIGEFLKFARPEKPDCSWVRLRDCISEVREMLTAGSNFPENVAITLDFQEDTDIWADEKQLFALLTHFMQNAMPFCPRGEEKLLIKAEECGSSTGKAGQSETRLTIADNGSGIKEGDEANIFEPFYTTRADGTGLGLAIAQQIALDHGGSVSVENSGLVNKEGGRGAAFTIIFPLPDGEKEG